MRVHSAIAFGLLLAWATVAAAHDGHQVPSRDSGQAPAPIPYQHRFQFDLPPDATESAVASDVVPASKRLEVHFIECHIDSSYVFLPGDSRASKAWAGFSIESGATGLSWVLIPEEPPQIVPQVPPVTGTGFNSRWGYSKTSLLHFPASDSVNVKVTRYYEDPATVTGACTLSGFLFPK